MMKSVLVMSVVSALAVLCNSGCGTTAPSRYYVLAPGENIPVNLVHHEHLQDLKVVVVPAIIPKHLDRPVLVAYSGDHELVYSEFERWAEPLADNVTRVLVGNLEQLLAGAHVASKALVDERSADYIIRPQVEALQIKSGEALTLDMRWNIIRGADYVSVAVGRFEESTPLVDAEESTAVSVASDLLLKASRALAADVIEASGSDPAN